MLYICMFMFCCEFPKSGECVCVCAISWELDVICYITVKNYSCSVGFCGVTFVCLRRKKGFFFFKEQIFGSLTSSGLETVDFL